MPAVRRNSRPRKQRHSSTGYARGDDTKNRLLEIAIGVFGESGYDGTSTRLIASKAGANTAALQYYFDGKEGLYLACAGYLADRMLENIQPLIAEADKLLRESADRDSMIDQVCGILDRQAVSMFGASDAREWVLFLAREQIGLRPGPAFDIIYERLTKPTTATLVKLVSRILDRLDDDPQVLITVLAIIGQLMYFRIGYQTALRMLGWQDFTGERLDHLRSVLQQHVRAMLAAAPSSPS